MKTKERHFSSTLIALGVALVFIVSLGFASDSDDQCDYMSPPEFDWDGDVNPWEFTAWEVVGVLPQGPFLVIGLYKNPDETAAIKIVAGLVEGPDGVLVSYRYFKNGHPYQFDLNPGNSKYEEYKFTQEEKRGCMECHQDKLILGENI